MTGLDLSVREQEITAIIGNSGSGKSTLLNLLGGLDQASAGQVEVAGIDMNALTKRGLNRYRQQTVGFVWQNPARNLIPYLSALQNVELAMRVLGRVDKAWAKRLLELVNLGDLIHGKPMQMSGGQQQRVAIAVSLANRPRILLADEPTGAVDTATASGILALLRQLRDELGLTVLLVTHDPRIANAVERTVSLRDGRVAQESVRTDGQDVSLEEAFAAARRDYVLMDARGRLQVPADLLDAAGMRNARQLSATAEDQRIVLSRADS